MMTFFHRTTVDAVEGIPYGDWEDWGIEFEYLDKVEARFKKKLGLLLSEDPFTELDAKRLGLLKAGDP